MIADIHFNFGISISILVAGVLILTLIIFEFITYMISNKFLIFKNPKITNFGWIINFIVLIIVLVISILLLVISLSQTKYVPYMSIWWLITWVSLCALIIRTILTTKSRKNKHEIKNIFSISVNELANKFKIKDFNNPIFNIKHIKKNKWYMHLKQNFESLLHKIDTINSNNIKIVASEIITFEETYCATVFNKMNKYAFCLFLILLNNLQKRIKTKNNL